MYMIGRAKSGHSFRLHPEALYAVVDDLEVPSNGGVAKVCRMIHCCFLKVPSFYILSVFF